MRKLVKVGMTGAAALLALGGIGVANAASSDYSDPTPDPSASASTPAGDPVSSDVTPAGCRITVLTDPKLAAGKVTARTEIHCPVSVNTLSVTTINLVNVATGDIVAYNYTLAAKTDHVESQVTFACKSKKRTKYRVEVIGMSNEDHIAFGYAMHGKSINQPTLKCGG